MTRRLLFVHAHPDDESSKGAATAARYVDEGAEVVLVTCSGGEAGEVLNPNADPVEPARMAQVRARELEDAIEAIGFTRAHQLGFIDSGYHERAEDIPAGTFAATDVDVAAAALARLLRSERPHVVVTYPEDGGYPHPDHIMVHKVTMRAVDLAADESFADPRPAWRVRKVYAAHSFSVERLSALHDGLVAAGHSGPYVERLRERRDRKDDVPIDTRIRCDAFFERRDAALRSHVTQIDPDGHWFEMPRDLERQHYPYDGYTLLRSDVDTSLPEDDLFAGIVLEADTASAASHGTGQ